MEIFKITTEFWKNVDKTDSCWIWKGKKSSEYGFFKINKIWIGAHRIAWQLIYGEIPNGLFVCHKCDNPPCVKPDHLFLGTAKDNNQDAAKKGRFSGKRIPFHLRQKQKAKRNKLGAHLRKGNSI
jgi:hypothetical protein